MARLSVLPGRLRYEAKGLIGNRHGCDFLEKRILSLNGVSEISSSHRTGRLLVRFDEDALSRCELEAQLVKVLQEVSELKDAEVENSSLHRGTPHRSDSSPGVGHFVMEMALHAFLPAPLDLLLPAAAALRR